ncbi:hypothetical protein HKCCE3408_17535 [Rhodobacterales bacterium HKCCE3408]|nr:hypothetical protein [Rhodobacterales bacterium HKCCE3408]
MCLSVYLGTDAPVAGFSDVAIGAIGLDPRVGTVPTALADKAHVAVICDRVPTGWNCSCIFLDRALPWEDPEAADDPEAGARRGAYARLREIAAAAVALDPEALLFSCWSGDEGAATKVERALAPAELLADRYIFDDVHDGGSGGNPPVLVRLTGGSPCFAGS